MVKIQRAIHLFPFFILLVSHPVYAQITSDSTLSNPSVVTQSGNNYSLTGGTIRQNSLFHSFQEFSLLNGQKASFNQPNSVRNIFSRVTGSDVSNINGVINVIGNANLFFFNSNGINLFNGARFVSSGSITLSTSPRINFSNLDFFDTSGITSIIPINASDSFNLELQGSKPINIYGNGHNLIFNNPERNPGSSIQPLSTVSPNQFTSTKEELNLIGNQINLSGALVTSGGDINLFSGQMGNVKFDRGVNKNNPVHNFRASDITLANKSLIETTGTPTASIRLFGDSVNLKNSSLLHSANFGGFSTSSIEVKSNKLFINGISDVQASKAVRLSPSSVILSGIITQNFNGKGADINIKSNQIELSDFGTVSTINDGFGQSGDINIHSDSIIVDGTPPAAFLLSSISSTQIQGLSGKISIAGSTLKLSGGAQVISLNLTLTPGFSLPGGDIDINVGSIDIEGNAIVDGPIPDIVSSNIATASVLTGNGGNIDISGKQIMLRDSGAILSGNSGLGRAGNVSISADSIDVQGITQNVPLDRQSGILASAILISPLLRQLFQSPQDNFTGDSGILDIEARSLTISNGGIIGVLNEGNGDAGSVNIESKSLRLDNSSIFATTNGGNGGNINLLSDLITLTNSNISASAKGFGLGGNVSIDSSLFATSGKSNISANAENNAGGQIFIRAAAVKLSPATTVSASSNLGPNFEGRIAIDQTQSDIGFFDSTTTVVQPPETIVSGCTTRNASITEAGMGAGNQHEFTEQEIRHAKSLKQRLAIANQYTYIDTETGKEMPFKRWLGVQKRADGNLEFVFDPSQSPKLTRLLSAVENTCSL